MTLMVLAIAAGCVVTAVHVDHGLRPGSAAEADVVAAAAARFGAAFRSETVEVRIGPNLEARARDARYAVLPNDVMTGHTADDQAETMLINLMRGASSTGLAGMRPGPRRPILALRRASDRQVLPRLGDHDRRRSVEPRSGLPAQSSTSRTAAADERVGRARPGAGADSPGGSAPRRQRPARRVGRCTSIRRTPEG